MSMYRQLLKVARDRQTNWRIVENLYRSYVDKISKSETLSPVEVVIEIERLSGIMRDYAKRRGETFHALRID